MDDVSALNDWRPSRTLPGVTSTFATADAGVTLKTGKLIGNARSSKQWNDNNNNNNNNNDGNKTKPSLKDYIQHTHSHTSHSPDRTGQINLAGSPNMPKIERKRLHYTKPKTTLRSMDGSVPWVPAAAGGGGGADAPIGVKSSRKRMVTGRSNINDVIVLDTPTSQSLMSGTAKKLAEGGAPDSPAPKQAPSPAHTRIFESEGRQVMHVKPSPPRGVEKVDPDEKARRMKFNACRQVMDVLEKHDYKLKNTFYHYESPKTKNPSAEKSSVVRTNHTIGELTNALVNLGAKVDESAVRAAFGDEKKGSAENITYSQLAAKATDTVYPGASNGDPDFFKPLPREGKRVGCGPGAKHNTFRSTFLDHDMTPSVREETSYVEKYSSSRQVEQQPQTQVGGGRNDSTYMRWTDKSVDRRPKMGLGYGKKANGEMKGNVTKDSMTDLVFHGQYESMKPLPVSKLQYETASQRAPFANYHNTPLIGGSGAETEGIW